jgi:hypothetical protein
MLKVYLQNGELKREGLTWVITEDKKVHSIYKISKL